MNGERRCIQEGFIQQTLNQGKESAVSGKKNHKQEKASIKISGENNLGLLGENQEGQSKREIVRYEVREESRNNL